MIPGMNSRQMKQAMKKMGMQQEDLAAEEVIIRLADKDIVISNPDVAKVNMMGQETYQIVGEAHEVTRDTAPEINDEDVETVMEQAKVDKQSAVQAIQDAGGDLAQAILFLQEENEE
ncbi:nascent polypeptide-associated complex protein [Candidatus Woesearchaeota archaeon]|nr:nascent polypeptide-associated complex protein [Candidatus Woesearchaeota archaeon]